MNYMLQAGNRVQVREKGMGMISKHLRKLVKEKGRLWQRRWMKIGKHGQVERNDVWGKWIRDVNNVLSCGQGWRATSGILYIDDLYE
jgi:hypothetical protein